MISAGEPVKAPRALDRMRVYLLYHELQPGRSEYGYALDTELFREHLEVFRGMRANAAAYWPEITFDDGHVSNFEYAMPLLEEAGLKAVFFITAGWTAQKAGYMGWKELRALQQAGHAIGAHGLTHTLLTHCEGNALGEELTTSRSLLEDGLSVPVTTMSLPGGRSNARVLQACAEAGYTQVYTSEPKAESHANAATMGRLNVHGSRSAAWMRELLRPESGVLRGLGRQYRVKAAAQQVLGDTLYGKMWARLNRQDSSSRDGGR